MILTATSGSLLASGTIANVLLNGWRSAFGGQEGSTLPLISRPFYAGAIVAGIWIVLPKAWIAIRKLRPDMNLLMTVAVVGGVGDR